jgi:hypothetical protein
MVFQSSFQMRRLSPTVSAACKRQLSQRCGRRHIGAIFSGIQPTGVPHIGNYIGALRQWIQLQGESPNVFYSIVDLHALTPRPRPELLRTWKRETLAALLAAGIDHNRSTLFYQSSVSSISSPQHFSSIHLYTNIGGHACGTHVDPELYCFSWLSVQNDAMEGMRLSRRLAPHYLLDLTDHGLGQAGPLP